MKELSTLNWIKADETSKTFARLASDGRVERLTAGDWAKAFLDIALRNDVPQEIREQFEVARGVMLYGWFFYPLYTVGQDQLYRVVDSALAHKCRSLGAPNLKTFNDRIDWLVRRGILSSSDERWWRALKDLRNITSHAEMQRIGMPTEALHQLGRIASRINSLVAPALSKQIS